MEKKYHVYIMTNAHCTVLYAGFSGNIIKRGWQHKKRLVDGLVNDTTVQRWFI